MAARILVIDDSPEYRQILRDLAVSRGWEVRTCSSGSEGLTAALADPPQLIVTDVELGDADGRSLCERLRREPSLKAVPILMISGTYRLEEDRARGLHAGADAYLLKPFDLEEFLRTASSLLRL